MTFRVTVQERPTQPLRLVAYGREPDVYGWLENSFDGAAEGDRWRAAVSVCAHAECSWVGVRLQLARIWGDADEDGHVQHGLHGDVDAASEVASLRFTIVVRSSGPGLGFGGARIRNQTYTIGTPDTDVDAARCGGGRSAGGVCADADGAWLEVQQRGSCADGNADHGRYVFDDVPRGGLLVIVGSFEVHNHGAVVSRR